MCGIGGVFAYKDDRSLVDQGELLRIQERMRNRGPDGEGLWISKNRRIGLVHRRLSIIDLSKSGDQPMQDPDNGNQIVFNGEVYNYPALRRELELAGQIFRSNSDTEVLLKLYAIHGKDMVYKLRGMYAFVIWDMAQQGTFIARDPFGIKPLYFADDGKTFRFASQVKALLAGGAVNTQPEPAGHVGFFLWGSVPEPYTLFKGIRAFPPGTSLWINSSGNKEEICFFDLSRELTNPIRQDRSLSKEDAHEILRAALLDSVRHHLVSDVPVGIFLSAGIDSSALLGLTRECQPELATIKTLTLAFHEFVNSNQDEAPIAKMVAEFYGAEHNEQFVNQTDFDNQFANLISAMDQPSIDGVNSYFICMAARKVGLKVAFSGIGGDEIFSGYSHFSSIPSMVRCIKPLAKIPTLGRGLRNFSSPILQRYKFPPKYAGLIEYGGNIAGAYLLRRSLFCPWELDGLLDRDFVLEGLQTLQTLPALNATIRGISDNQSSISALEIRWYMLNQLLRDADWAGMSHGVEVRLPFVDVELFRTIQSLAVQNLSVKKKNIAVTPLRPLPAEIINRKKTGFSVPVRQWLQGHKELKNFNEVGLRGWAVNIYRQFLSEPISNHGDAKNLLLTSSDTSSKQLQIGLLAPELSVRGGIQSFMMRLNDLMENLVSNGDFKRASLFSLNDSKKSLRSHIGMHSNVHLWGANKSKIRFIFQLVCKMPRQDVLIVGHIYMGPIAHLLQKLGKVKRYYVILHGIESWQQLNILERQALLAADNIIATTSFTANECARHNGIPPAKFQIIPLCSSERQIVSSSNFKLNGEFKLLFVGRLDQSERYKGLEQIFHAIKRLKDSPSNIHLNIVGDGNDKERMTSIARQLGILEQVTFWGSICDEDLNAAYRDCDVFVMPSCKEGFGIVFLEAMRWGKPCIGGNHGGTPDVIAHEISGYLVEYGDVKDLADRIRLLSENIALRLSLGKNGVEFVRQKFSKKKFNQNYSNLIKQSIKNIIND